jgi:hypothetical protein
MSQSLAARSPIRAWLLVFALIVAVLALLLQLRGWTSGLTALPLHDFVEYWAAGRLNVHGDNPYDPQRVHELERATGRTSEGVLMWNPPWTLPLVMPLGLLDCRTAHWLWLCLHFAIVTWCADTLWRLYGGPVAQRWIAWLLAFSFLPTVFSLTAGQISPLVLLGAVFFLVCIQRGHDALAGATAVLLAIKPHLSYLFWIALLFWSVRQRRWSVLGGGLLTGALATGIALWCNPAVLSQYWHTFTHQPPAQYRSPTLGTLLRWWLSEDQFRLQFLALIPGLLWFVPYWLRHREGWDWSEHLPLLLLVSLLTAAYGAWPFDLVLLLVPVVQQAAMVSRQGRRSTCFLAIAAYLAIDGLAAGQLASEVEYFWFIWMTPALLCTYLVLRRIERTPFPRREATDGFFDSPPSLR